MSIFVCASLCVCVHVYVDANLCLFKDQVPLLLFLEYISHLHIAILECRLLEAISSQLLSDG